MVVMLLFSIGSINANAQIPLNKYSIQGNFSIPNLLNSPAYRNIFSGIVSTNLSFNVHTKKGLYGKIGTHYVQNKTANSRNFNLSVFEVKHHIISPLAGVGYEYNNGGRMIAGIDFCYLSSFGKYTRSLVPDTVTTPYPPLSQHFNELALTGYVSLFTDENLSFGINLGYHYQFIAFNPYPYYFNVLNSTVNYYPQMGKFNSYFTFGLGFQYHFSPFKIQPVRNVSSS